MPDSASAAAENVSARFLPSLLRAAPEFAGMEGNGRPNRPPRCNLQTAKTASVAVCKNKTYGRATRIHFQSNPGCEIEPAYGVLINTRLKNDEKAKQTDNVFVGPATRDSMNQKKNWTRRSRMNAATRDIPVRFSRGAAGFEVKIKSSARHRIPVLETPLVQRSLDLNTRPDGINDMSALALLRTRSVLALVTLPESTLAGRRLEALLKAARKKRC